MVNRRLIVVVFAFFLSAKMMAATGGGSTPPAGSNTQVQFNKRGSFGADSNLTYSTATRTLTVPKVQISTVSGITLMQFGDGTQMTTAASGNGGGGAGYAVEPATVTFLLNKGVRVSTVVVNNTTTQNGIYVNQTGNADISYWNGAKGGAVVIDKNSIAATDGLVVISSQATQASIDSLAHLVSLTTSYNEIMLWIQSNSDSTIGANADLRIDANNPDIELQETDQLSAGTGNGKWEIAVNGDQFQINQRNAGDSSFQTLLAVGRDGSFRYKELDNGGDYVGFISTQTLSASFIYVLPSNNPVDGAVWHTHGFVGGTYNTYWDRVNLSTEVAGTLAIANGGTGRTTQTQNGVVIGGLSSYGMTSAGTEGTYLQTRGSTPLFDVIKASDIAAGVLGPSVRASSFPVSGVTPGSYTNANITVSAQGIVTSAGNGGNPTVLAVSSNNVIVSSPTMNINFMPPFIVALQGSTSAQITVNSSSFTLQGVLNDIHNQNSLQSGATAYPDFLYNGSSASLKGVTLNDLTASLPIKTDANKKLTAAAIDLSGTEATGTMAAGRFPALTGDVTNSAGSLTTTVSTTLTAYIQNRVTLQSGSTAYPDFLYNGSSASLKGVTLNDLTASLPLKTDANKKLTAAAINLSGSEVTGTLASGSIPTNLGAYVQNSATLQAGSTSYTDFIYNGSSASLKGVTLNDLSASLPVKTDSNKKLTAAAVNLSGSEVTGTLSDGSLSSNVDLLASTQTAIAQKVFKDVVVQATFTVVGSTMIINGSTTYWNVPRPAGNRVFQMDSSGNVTLVTDQTSAGGGDNLGNHVATMTLTTGFGINSSTGIFTSTGTQPTLSLVANGIYGVSAGTSGGLLVDCSGGGAASGMCAQIYSIAGAQIALGGLLNVISASNTFNEPAVYIKQTSTNGGAANIRMDGPAPQIEFVENDQSTPAGKYELGVNGDIFYVDGRNGADNAFENIFRVVRKAASGGGYAATLSSAPFRFFDGTSAHYVSLGSSNTVASNVNWILPSSDRVGVIQSDGAGNLFLTPASTIAVAAVGISQLSATGSPSATTFLRGDNAWVAPAGSGDAVLAATQTFSGADTFTSSVTFVGRVLDSTLSAGTSSWVFTSRGNSVGAQWMPGGSGTGDITDVFNCASGDCNSIVMADGDLLDASNIIPSAATEGIIITTGTDCTSMTARGQLCYDTDNLKLSIGSGTANPVIVNQTVVSLLPETAQFLTVNFPQLSRSTTTFPTSFLAYDATTDETAFWKFSVPNYSTGPAQVTVYWHADSSTQGAVTWEMQFSTKTPNVDTGDMESGGSNIVFGAISGTTTVHPGLPVKRLLSTTWMATYEQMARMKSGDLVMVRLARDANATNGTDSLAGDAKLDYCEIKW